MILYAIEMPYEGISGYDLYPTMEARSAALDTHYSYVSRWLEVTIEVGPEGSEVVSREMVERAG